MRIANINKWNRLAKYQEMFQGDTSENISDIASSNSLNDSSPGFDKPVNNKSVVRCLLCPHYCIIREGKTGICLTRINRDGKLYTMAYGNPCSISIDPIEKKPLFHFCPGTKIYSLSTTGCNLHCLNCQNWSISQKSPEESAHYDILPVDVVAEALRHNVNSIAFTYTEPTVFYEYVWDIAREAHNKGVKTVFISNGYINQKPLLDLCPYLDAANIDLKSFDDSVYRKLSGGKLQPVLDTLKTLKEKGIWLEITSLIVPSLTDNPEMIKKMCIWLVENGFAETPLHFSRFFPTYMLLDLQPTPADKLFKAREIAMKTGMKYVYIGNLPGLHGENTVCPKCGQMIIEREGYQVRWSKRNILSKSLLNNSMKKAIVEQCSFCGEIIAGVWS